jgi:hypothetical protein
MTQLVTLDEAKAHLNLRAEDTDQDDYVTILIESASAAVLAYIGDAQYLFLDTGGDELELEETGLDQEGLRARHLARQATLLMVGEFFRNREPAATDVVPERFGYGYLPRAVVALLMSLRTPTVA